MISAQKFSLMDFIYILFFFPSITFNILPAEIFPWGLLLLFSTKTKYSKTLFCLFLFLTILMCFSIMVNINKIEVIRASMAYINILFFVNYLLCADKETIIKISKLIQPIFIFLLILGLLQYLRLLKFLNPVFSFLISRGSSDLIESGGRGVRLLATEPSRAGIELVYLYTFIRLSISGKRKIDILLFLYMLLVIRSATSLFVLLLVYLFDYRKSLIPLMFFSSLVIIILSYIISQNEELSSIRVIFVIKNIFQQDNFKAIWLYVINSSGFRIISVMGAYIFGVMHPFGGMIGNWKVSSLESLRLTGFQANQINYFRYWFNSEYSPVRPTAFSGNILLDFGLIGLLCIVIIIFFLIKKYKLVYPDKAKTVLFLFLFTIFFYGTSGHPMIWIVFILAGKNKLMHQSFCKRIS